MIEKIKRRLTEKHVVLCQRQQMRDGLVYSKSYMLRSFSVRIAKQQVELVEAQQLNETGIVENQVPRFLVNHAKRVITLLYPQVFELV